MNTEITIPIDDLNREEYRFYFLDNMGHNPKLVLNFYAKYSRQTKRHGWKCEGGFYDRLNGRNSQIKISEVPITDEIKKMALDKFVSTITVTVEIG